MCSYFGIHFPELCYAFPKKNVMYKNLHASAMADNPPLIIKCHSILMAKIISIRYHSLLYEQMCIKLHMGQWIQWKCTQIFRVFFKVPNWSLASIKNGERSNRRKNTSAENGLKRSNCELKESMNRPNQLNNVFATV